MRKRLALVLLAPECCSWQTATSDALPVWPGVPPVFAPWMAAQSLAEAWMRMLMELMSWMFIPRTRD